MLGIFVSLALSVESTRGVFLLPDPRASWRNIPLLLITCGWEGKWGNPRPLCVQQKEEEEALEMDFSTVS